MNSQLDDSRFKTFTDLDSWSKCRLLRKKISEFARNLPSEEKHRLADQMIRASRSVTNNIAEGYGRYNFKDTARFFTVARGSLSELLDHMSIAWDEGYMNREQLSQLSSDCHECMRLINGYIRYLNKNTQTKPH